MLAKNLTRNLFGRTAGKNAESAAPALATLVRICSIASIVADGLDVEMLEIVQLLAQDCGLPGNFPFLLLQSMKVSALSPA